MTKLKKYLCKYNEHGFINPEHEQLEKYIIIGVFAMIFITLAALVVWVLHEQTSHSINM